MHLLIYQNNRWELAWETDNEALARQWCEYNRTFCPCRIQWESGTTVTWY
jgi:hypothetical protein